MKRAMHALVLSIVVAACATSPSADIDFDYDTAADFTALKTFGVVESVKAVSDLFAPVTGEVVEVNAELPKQPELVNTDPYGKGWMLVIRMANPKDVDGLMSAGDYEKLIADGGGH